MLLISNNAKYFMEIPKNATIRVNMAWVKTEDELESIILENADREIFLDFPSGRTKPPTPVLKIDSAHRMIEKYSNIKYFALSNVENADYFSIIKSLINKRVKLVPKIETSLGVKNFLSICKAGDTDILMLDKEDLYTSVLHNSEVYNKLLKEIRLEAKLHGIKVLELETVVFGEHK